MKKQLLMSTALIAAGMFAMSDAAVAQKKKMMGPTASVGGYGNAYFGFANNDEGKLRTQGVLGATGNVPDTNIKFDSEIWFNGKVTTDNGLNIAARIELEGPDDAQNFDEAYLRTYGDFGDLRIGQEDSSTQLMTTGYYGIWATAAGTQYDVERGSWILGLEPVGITPATMQDDDDRITYITPRIQGFQLGVSYAPDRRGNAANRNGNNGTKSIGNPATLAGGNDQDLFSVSANFVRSFGDAKVGLAVGYESNNSRAPAARGGDPSQITVAGSVEWGPVKVAAGYTNQDGCVGGCAFSQEGDMFQVGGRFTMGPNAFSVGYHRVDVEGRNPAVFGAGPLTNGNYVENGFLASAARTLAPGTKLSANLIYADGSEGRTAGHVDIKGLALLGMLAFRF